MYYPVGSLCYCCPTWTPSTRTSPLSTSSAARWSGAAPSPTQGPQLQTSVRYHHWKCNFSYKASCSFLSSLSLSHTLFLYLSLSIYMYLSIFLSIHISIYIYTYLIYLSFCQSIIYISKSNNLSQCKVCIGDTAWLSGLSVSCTNGLVACLALHSDSSIQAVVWNLHAKQVRINYECSFFYEPSRPSVGWAGGASMLLSEYLLLSIFIWETKGWMPRPCERRRGVGQCPLLRKRTEFCFSNRKNLFLGGLYSLCNRYLYDIPTDRSTNNRRTWVKLRFQ